MSLKHSPQPPPPPPLDLPPTRRRSRHACSLTALLGSPISLTVSSLAHATGTVGRETAVSPRARRRRVSRRCRCSDASFFSATAPTARARRFSRASRRRRGTHARAQRRRNCWRGCVHVAPCSPLVPSLTLPPSQARRGAVRNEIERLEDIAAMTARKEQASREPIAVTHAASNKVSLLVSTHCMQC